MRSDKSRIWNQLEFGLRLRNDRAMQDDFWEQNAAQWDRVIDAGVFKSRKITSAAILNEIKRHQFKSLLDIGCGEGWIAGALDLKSVDYLGIDGSNALIEIAKAKHRAQFKKASYDELTQKVWNPKRKFNGILFNFCLFDEDVSDVLRTSSQFLQKGGLILIQTLHPCFALAEYRDGWNSEDFKSSGAEFSGEMPWYGRTLAGWTAMFEKSGLVIKEIVEPMNEGKPASIIFILGPSAS